MSQSEYSQKPPVHPTKPEASPSTGIRLMALREGCCRWPTEFTEAGEQLFCGAACAPLPNVYCKAHKLRAHTKGRY